MGIPFKQYLYGGILFATVLIVLLNYWIFRTPETALQEFCAITLYFSFLAWACGQLWLIRMKERKQALPGPAKPATPDSIAEIQLEEPAVSLAETYLELGENIDTVCAVVEPRFADWTASQRASYRESLMTAVQERRPKLRQEGESA